MFPRRLLLKSATALVSALVILPGTATADEPLPVVATFSILGDMVSRIGGEHIALTTLVGPEGDTHVYQPTPRDAAAVAAAQVLFMNGLEFEGWLQRLSEAAPFEGEMVVATTGITPIAFEDDSDHDAHADHDDHGDHAGHDNHDDHGDHHGHDHGAFDPHAWHTIENAIIYADNIATGLAKADPENASAYFANRATYVAELEALSTEIDSMIAEIPEDKRTVVTSHDAFGYLAAHFGLRFLAPQGLSTESEASAADVAALITQIRTEGISAVFVETVADSRLIEQIARETEVSIGGALYADTLTDTSGPAATYLDMMRHNAMTLSAALGG